MADFNAKSCQARSEMTNPLRIMISSTRADLMQYRETASAIIEKLRKENQAKHSIIEVSMEEDVQTGNREYAVALSKKWVEDSDWVILIVGWHYGTISDEVGAGGFGVTEWEYRRARELNKLIFVFASGLKGSADAYEKSMQEKVNLIEWALEQTPEQMQKLKAFRQELTTPHSAFFKNLETFAKKLELTLREAIDKLPLVIPLGSSLAELILAVEPAIEECDVSVMRLKCYKDIHDALHCFLQEVIKSIRDEVFSTWAEEGNLSRGIERKLLALDKAAAVGMQLIRDKKSSIHPGQATDLAEALDAVEQNLPAWDHLIVYTAPEAQQKINIFSEKLDSFAAAVQVAFNLANEAMQRQNRIFDRLHGALQNEIDKARREKGLSVAESATLDEEIGKVRRNAEDLARTLDTHTRWQSMHDKIVGLQEHRGTVRYAKTFLPNFFINEKSRMERLTADALLYARLKPEARGELLIPHLETLELSVADWCARDDIEAFDRLRNDFDISFFKIDKNTQRVVTRSADRVNGLKNLLRSLHKEKMTKDKKTTNGEPT